MSFHRLAIISGYRYLAEPRELSSFARDYCPYVSRAYMSRKLQEHGAFGGSSAKTAYSRQYSDTTSNIDIPRLIHLSLNLLSICRIHSFYFQATAQLREAFKNPAVVPDLVTVLGSSQNPQVKFASFAQNLPHLSDLTCCELYVIYPDFMVVM